MCLCMYTLQWQNPFLFLCVCVCVVVCSVLFNWVRWCWLMWWFECRDIDMVSRLASAAYHMSSKEAYYEERRKGCASLMSSSCRSYLCRHHFRRHSPFHDRSHFCYYRCCHSFSQHHRFHLSIISASSLLLWSSSSFWIVFWVHAWYDERWNRLPF